jgi:hypothetical protein
MMAESRIKMEKILNALERCVDNHCEKCDYKTYGDMCMDEMLKGAIELIKGLAKELKEARAAQADTVRKMQAMIQERCIEGGIYPVIVKNAISQVAKQLMEDTK